jgi:hypothetical protein
MKLGVIEEHRLGVFENMVLRRIFDLRGSSRRLEKIIKCGAP